jgi:hypothetical protein
VYYGGTFAHLSVDNKELPPAGDVDSLRHSLERLPEEDLLAIVRDAEVTRVLAARALLERNLDFDELFILAMDVPAIRNDFWKGVKSRASNEQLLRIMKNLPDLEERAARLLLARQPTLGDRIGEIRAEVHRLLQ